MAIKTHTIKDMGAPFVVDPYERKVTVPHTQRVIGVVGDDRSEQVTFQVPNVIDGHNMPACDRKYVAWRNVEGTPGSDELKLVTEAEDHAIYAWTVRDALTVAKGLVEFSLHFECDDSATGARIYSWGTQACTSCEILDSVNTILGTYAHIYVSGERLVFADYTPVVRGRLSLQSPGIFPEGTLSITANGTYDVMEYQYADVQLPAPNVDVRVRPATSTDGGLDGYVQGFVDDVRVVEKPLSRYASALGIVEYNIRKGVTLFGVTGTCETTTEIVNRYDKINVTFINDFGVGNGNHDFGNLTYSYENTGAADPALQITTASLFGADNGGNFGVIKGSLFIFTYSSYQDAAYLEVTCDDPGLLANHIRTTCEVDNAGSYNYTCVYASSNNVTFRLTTK